MPLAQRLFLPPLQQAFEYSTITACHYTGLHVFLHAQAVASSLAIISACFNTISVASNCMSGG